MYRFFKYLREYMDFLSLKPIEQKIDVVVLVRIETISEINDSELYMTLSMSVTMAWIDERLDHGFSQQLRIPDDMAQFIVALNHNFSL